MRLKFEFSNGVPSVDVFTSTDGFSPVELVVNNGGRASRKKALSLYMQTIDYAFRNVINRVTVDINRFLLTSTSLGWLDKDSLDVAWGLKMEDNMVVVYDITTKEVNEHLYISKGIATGDGKSIKPVWFKEVVDGDAISMKKHIIAAISVITEQVSEYDLVWDSEKSKLSIRDHKGREVNLDKISKDDLYTLFLVINLIVTKGTHTGVFFINCRGFSDDVLNTLMSVIKEIYGNTFVFLYNCENLKNVKRDVVKLPNFIVREGASI